MKKRTENAPQKIYVSVNELKEMLSVGRNTALKVGDDANAKIKIGKRTLYNVEKITSYLETLNQ